jgi:K+-transporting ATPase ATPase C chain
MLSHVRANLWLLVLTLVLCSGVYPLALWAIGQTVFRQQAEGSLLHGPDGKVVGSRLIAQPFTADEYFQPRPSAVSYNAAASGASNWGANNYLLRERVARQLGPLVKYHNGPRKGQPVGPDVESWFQKDRFQGKAGIVAQWAQAHPTVAQNWVKADKSNTEFVVRWQSSHPAEVAQWVKDNPDTPEPKPEDLAVPFFRSYSAAHPGDFPSADERNKTKDIQGIFFDMWRQEHPQADLEEVPADLVMASGSGLDPHITLKNALYQLDRVAAKWAKDSHRDEAQVRTEITDLLRRKAEAPFGALVGVDLVNVLEVNLALRDRFGVPAVANK